MLPKRLLVTTESYTCEWLCADASSKQSLEIWVWTVHRAVRALHVGQQVLQVGIRDHCGRRPSSCRPSSRNPTLVVISTPSLGLLVAPIQLPIKGRLLWLLWQTQVCRVHFQVVLVHSSNQVSITRLQHTLCIPQRAITDGQCR